MLKLDVPAAVERERAAQSVRSGSSLPPEIRAIAEQEGYRRDYRDALLADGRARNALAVAPDAGRSRTKSDECIGCPLHSDVLMRRLTQLNSSLWFEQANAAPEMIGIYLLAPPTIDYPEGKRYLFGFHSGIMPEFTLERTPDEFGEGVGILRQGYRTILSRLIRLRLIPLSQVEILFGPPSRDSAFWAALTGKHNLTSKELYGTAATAISI